MRALIFGLALAALPAPAAAEEADKPSIPELANQICDAMAMYGMTEIGPIHEAFEMPILAHLGISEEEPDRHIRIREFWNEHHQEMICTEKLPGLKSPQHILKRVIDMRETNAFYFNYFLADRKVKVNAVEKTPEGPKTVLDHIDEILATPDSRKLYHIDEIRTLRSFLVDHMNGKRGEELMAEKDRTED